MLKVFKKYGLIKFYLLFVDFTIFIVAFYLSYWKRFHSIKKQFNIQEFCIFLLLFSIWIYILKNRDVYKHRIYVSRIEHLMRLLKALLIFFIVMVIIELFFRISLFHQSRLMIIYFLFCLVSLYTIFRIGLFYILYPIFAKNKYISRKTIIVGIGKNAEIIAGRIIGDETSPIEIIGFINDQNGHKEELIFSKPILGSMNNIETIVKFYRIDKLIIALDEDIGKKQFFTIFDMCKKTGLSVLVSSTVFQIVTDRLQNHEYESAIGLRFVSYEHNMIDCLLKRIFDLFLASFALLILIPILILLSMIIKLSSSGPIIFKQKRIGRKGKTFNFYKFRTMYINNDDSDHREYLNKLINKGEPITIKNGKKIFKIESDPRVTYIGRYFRKLSFDELPQLINIIKGDMSLVGPRPCLPYEYELYSEWHKRRLEALPGITGVWQVRGRSAVSFDDMVALDIFYVENWSFWLDLKILFQTIPVVLFCKGSH